MEAKETLLRRGPQEISTDYVQFQPRKNTSQPAALEIRNRQVYSQNLNNLRSLLDIQEHTQEGCFFIGMYGLLTAFYPDQPLPSSTEFLEIMKNRYAHVLVKDHLLVRYDRISQALGIYKQWGINLDNVTVNQVGQKVIGCMIKDNDIQVTRKDTVFPLEPDCHHLPFGLLVKQSGANNSHFITVDGLEKSTQVMQGYIDQKYRIIATFQYSPSRYGVGAGS